MQLELLIPILAIAGGIPLAAFTVWLDFKKTQRSLGASTNELEKEVSTLRRALDTSEAERKRLTERVQNLETIVTSESWDALREGVESRALGGGASSSSGAEQAGNPEEAARLARRVRP